MAGGDESKKNKPPKDGQKPEDEEPDIDNLMNDLKGDIERIYKYLEGKKDTDAETKKPPISML